MTASLSASCDPSDILLHLGIDVITSPEPLSYSLRKGGGGYFPGLTIISHAAVHFKGGFNNTDVDSLTEETFCTQTMEKTKDNYKLCITASLKSFW